MSSRIPDGQLVAGVLCIIDENPRPNVLFGAPAVSINQLAASLNFPVDSISSDQVVEAIRPLSESLFDTPRLPTIRRLNKQGRAEDWIVFESLEGSRTMLSRTPSPSHRMPLSSRPNQAHSSTTPVTSSATSSGLRPLNLSRRPPPAAESASPPTFLEERHGREPPRRVSPQEHQQSNRSFAVIGQDLLKPSNTEGPARIALPPSRTPSPRHSPRTQQGVESSTRDKVRFPRPQPLLPMPRPRPYRAPTLDSPLASAPLGPSRSLTLEPVSPDESYFTAPKSASLGAKSIFAKFRPPWKNKSVPSSPIESARRLSPGEEIEERLLHRKLMDQQNSYLPENLIMTTTDRLEPMVASHDVSSLMSDRDRPPAVTAPVPPAAMAGESFAESEEVDLIDTYSMTKESEDSEIEREVQGARIVKTQSQGTNSNINRDHRSRRELGTEDPATDSEELTYTARRLVVQANEMGPLSTSSVPFPFPVPAWAKNGPIESPAAAPRAVDTPASSKAYGDESGSRQKRARPKGEPREGEGELVEGKKEEDQPEAEVHHGMARSERKGNTDDHKSQKLVVDVESEHHGMAPSETEGETDQQQSHKLVIDVESDFEEEDNITAGELSPWEIESESDKDFDYYTEDGGDTPPPTPYLAKALEGLPFAPRRGLTTSSLVSWVSNRWQILAAELVAVIGLAYIVQASGF